MIQLMCKEVNEYIRGEIDEIKLFSNKWTNIKKQSGRP